MIRYSLRCADGHDFEGWFRSSADYEVQSSACEVACPECGSDTVEKAPMAPAVSRRDAAPSLDDPRLARLVALRRHVEQNFENVGDRFVKEARAIYEGNAEDRGIYGEARLDEVRELIEDGVPVAPLPDVPRPN